MWFIYALLVGMILFCIIRHLTIRILDWKREVIVSVLIVVTYVAGVYICQKKIGIEYHADKAMLIMPIIYIGFLVKKMWNRFPIKWYLGVLSLISVIAIYKITGIHVELSKQQIIGPIWFILVSFCGIYFNLVLAKILQKIQGISNLVAYLGEKSFDIMALHFIMFKVISLLYVVVYNKPYFWIAKFPIISPEWWVAYTFAGIFGSVAIIKAFAYFKSKCKNYINLLTTM